MSNSSKLPPSDLPTCIFPDYSAETIKIKTSHKIHFLIAAMVLLLLLVLTDILTGPASLSIGEVLTTLVNPSSVHTTTQTIIWTFRLPTALMAVMIGMLLGIAGGVMQTILNNPLASPYTLGVSSAASFGAAIAIICAGAVTPIIAVMIVPLGAFLFSMLSALAIYGIARFKRASTETIVLGGVALLFLFNSGVAFLQYVSSEEQLQAIVFWIFGSLQRATWAKVGVLGAGIVISFPIIIGQAWSLTAVRMGDTHAKALGINVEQLRLRMLLIISALTALAISFSGAIGFIGLVAPHLARMTIGEDHRFFLPGSALTGALLLSAASILCKVLIPGAVFPIGIATAFIGIPFFIMMVLGKQRNHW